MEKEIKIKKYCKAFQNKISEKNKKIQLTDYEKKEKTILGQLKQTIKVHTVSIILLSISTIFLSVAIICIAMKVSLL